MMIHEITVQVGRHKTRKRVGRGPGSGTGKTSGRGHKGAKSRAGFSRRPGFEGGQMSLIRRIPKRGFSNVQFRTLYHIVNVSQLEQACAAKSEVTVKSLAAAGLVRDDALPLKVLGNGELTKPLHVSAAKFSKTARTKIEAVGGSIIEIERKKWRRDPAAPKPVKRKKAAAAPAEK